jgi:membrane-bound lytic murein transglycosylase MltF
MLEYNRLGIFLSRPVAILFVLIYLSQSILIIYLVREKFDLENQLTHQRQRISELEEKLKIFQVIDDFQIGFTDKEKQQLADVVFSECEKYDYDPMFLMAVILTESSFKRKQISSSGARGLMQIRPFVGKSLANKMDMQWEGSDMLMQPEVNVQMGSRHLFDMILKFKDVRKAIISYNLGEAELRSRLREDKPLPSSYLNKVMENYKMLKERYRV